MSLPRKSSARRTLAALSVVLVAGALDACAALEAYSRRVAEVACRSAGTCTVYDDEGIHQEPCWPTTDGPMAYPGDPGWPFERGVCDRLPDDAPGTPPSAQVPAE